MLNVVADEQNMASSATATPGLPNLLCEAKGSPRADKRNASARYLSWYLGV